MVRNIGYFVHLLMINKILQNKILNICELKHLQDKKYKSNIYLSQIILLIYIVFKICEIKPALHEKNVFDFDFMYANISCLYPTFIIIFCYAQKYPTCFRIHQFCIECEQGITHKGVFEILQ